MTARARTARPQAALALCARRWCGRLRRPTSHSMGAITLFRLVTVAVLYGLWGF